MDAMTLFGAGLIVGGLALLGYAFFGLRARGRPARRGRDWSELDRSQRPPSERRVPDRMGPVPHIQRSTLLEDTVPVNQEDTVRITAGLGGVHAGVD